MSHPGHLVLVGPTASGKSAVAMELARRRTAAGVPTEIVSCDSMQVYRHMDIGTAKATPAERAEIPHHLIDLVEPSEDHDLAFFLDAAQAALREIEQRGSSALLVGGTGLYVRAVVDGFCPPPHFPGIAAQLETRDARSLAGQLAVADPVALSRIPDGNRRRLVRALEVTIGTGVPFSEHGRPLESYGPTPFVLCGLRPARHELSEAIGQRLEAQLDAGFLAEVRRLHAMDPPISRTARQALGYRELLGHLDGEASYADAIERARVRTRRFAVRQLRWFGRDPRIEWLAPPGAGRPPAAVARELEAHWRKTTAGDEACATTVGTSVRMANDQQVVEDDPSERS